MRNIYAKEARYVGGVFSSRRNSSRHGGTQTDVSSKNHLPHVSYSIYNVLMPLYHPVVSQILQIITDNVVWYETFEHEPVVTSEDAAKVRTGYTLSQGAKAIIVKVDSRQSSVDSQFVMLVLPGDKKIDNKKVKALLGVKSYSFANPEELAKVTGGVERGGVPPWGNLFDMTVYADHALCDHEKIIFNAGDRRYSIAMQCRDYVSLVQPHMSDITVS